jgi:uncharacterized protein with HEPN domain
MPPHDRHADGDPRDVCQWLVDVVAAGEGISSMIALHTPESFQDDRVAARYVEREFEIIGEALKRVLQLEPGLSLRLHDAKDAIAFRNFLAHAYQIVDRTQVFQTAVVSLPRLVAECRMILDERGHRE